MTHFDLESWTDFVRNVAQPDDRRRAMAQHLDECSECAVTVARLRQVATLAAVDEKYEPPAHLLRHTRALFALERPRLIERLPRLAGRLMFDSFAQPMAAGVRGPAGVSRQTVFQAGEYAIDLTLERGHGLAETTLVGQVVSRDARRPLAAAPVLLTAGRTVVARTVSDAFGEFLLQYAARPDLHLQIAVDERERRIDIAVGDRTAMPSRSRRSAAPARRTRRPGTRRGSK
jgi:hypothetical protein